MPTPLARDIDTMLARLRARRSGGGVVVPGDPFASAMAGAHEAATSPWNSRRQPTPAMLAAGCYKVGPVVWKGLRLHIENPAHTVREGTSPDGTRWRNTMQAHYGYFAGTRGADGDGIDVFLGPLPESDTVWVLNQLRDDGGFDEHKVLAGFVDERAAVDGYRLSYSPGWDRYGAPVRLSINQLRWWLKWADHRLPLTPDLVPPEPETMTETTAPSALTRVFWDSAAMPMRGTVADVLYKIRLNDAAEGLLVDPMTMAELLDGAEVYRLDSLVIQAGRLKPKMDAMMRIMGAVGAEVQPVAVQISEPVRRFGGVHVAVLFELSDGQTVTVWFHNPDSTPNRISPADELVSWKWVLNKKDVTIVVAPESGQDLNMREVARRIVRLAAKNSAAFARANAKRAAAMAEIETLKRTLGEKQAALAELHRKIEAARSSAVAAEPAWKAESFDPATPANYRLLLNAGADALAHWRDVLEAVFFQRISSIRKALMALGWMGELFAGSLQRDGAVVVQEPERSGDAIVGVVWAITGSLDPGAKYGADGLRDDLSMTPQEVAVALTADVAKPAPEPAPLVPDTSAYVKWEAALVRVIEERDGVTTSDAQGMVMVKDAEVRAKFEAGATPEEAFSALWPEPAVESAAEHAAAPAADPAQPAPAADLVEVDGSALGAFEETPEGKRAMRAQADAAYRALGQTLPCPALHAEVQLRSSGRRKLLAMSADTRKLKLVPALPRIFAAARKVATLAPYNAAADTAAVAYHVLRAPVRLDGVDLAVRVVVKEDTGGKFHYDQTVHPLNAGLDGEGRVLDSAKENSPGEGLSPGATSYGEGSEPSRIARTERTFILDDAGLAVKVDEVLNLFIEGAPAELVIDDPDAAPAAEANEQDAQPGAGTEEPPTTQAAAAGGDQGSAGEASAGGATAPAGAGPADVEAAGLTPATVVQPAATAAAGTVEPEPASQQRADDLAMLEQVAAGLHPQMLEPELATSIEAALARWPGDTDVEQAAERAIDAYSNGLLQATAVA